MMVYPLLGSSKPLIWLSLIFGLTFYIFGISLSSGANTYLKPEQLWRDPSNEGLRDSFGTLGRSILSLYMAMAGGRSWGEYYHFLDSIPWMYQAIFLLFLTFTIFAVLNIVTGVFVDSAVRANTDSRQVVIQEELDAKKDMLRDLQNLFHQMDEDGDGSLTIQEFCSRLDDERVVAYFKALKLDIHDTVALFQVLDCDASQEVDVDEFLDGCYQLQGEARSIDTKMMRLQLLWLVQKVDELSATFKTHAALPVVQKLEDLQGRLKAQAAQMAALSQFVTQACSIWQACSQAASDSAACNGHAQPVASSEVVPTGATADYGWKNQELPGNSATFMHANGRIPSSRVVTAVKPKQGIGLFDAGRCRDQETLPAHVEASENNLHSFLMSSAFSRG